MYRPTFTVPDNPNTRYVFAVERVRHCKEAVMAAIEHLRREADYDYPPITVRQRIRDVQSAERAYREAWDERAKAERERARLLKALVPAEPFGQADCCNRADPSENHAPGCKGVRAAAVAR